MGTPSFESRRRTTTAHLINGGAPLGFPFSLADTFAFSFSHASLPLFPFLSFPCSLLTPSLANGIFYLLHLLLSLTPFLSMFDFLSSQKTGGIRLGDSCTWIMDVETGCWNQKRSPNGMDEHHDNKRHTKKREPAKKMMMIMKIGIPGKKLGAEPPTQPICLYY